METADYRIIKQLCENELQINNVDTIKILRLGGMTNRNYKVETEQGKFVVRFPGEGTKEMINRRDEYLSSVLVNKIGIDAELIYFGDTGIKITKYIEGAETMNDESIRKVENIKLVADILKRLHNYGESIPVVFDISEKIKEYELLIEKSPYKFWDDYHDVRKYIYQLINELKEMKINRTMCHNDPLCENFVKSNDKMYLIDWEYSGMNDPMWDIADVFIEANFSKEEEELFYRFYFDGPIDKSLERRIHINKIFLDFLWALWGIQRYTTGDDFFEYGCMRYERAKKNIEKLKNSLVYAY